MISSTARRALVVSAACAVAACLVAPGEASASPWTDRPVRRPSPAPIACKVPTLIGHRGEPVAAPENTLASFRAAIVHGANVVELDTRTTKDGAWVVIHDATLDRTTNGTGLVADRTLAEVRRLDAGQGERVPTLAEAYGLVASSPGVRVAVEVKSTPTPAQAAQLVDLARAAGVADRLVVISFSADTLATVRAVAPGTRTGWLSDASPTGQEALSHAPTLSAQWRTATPAKVAEWRAAGVEVWVWTVDDRTGWAAMRAAGVAAITTNRASDYRAWVSDVCRRRAA